MLRGRAGWWCVGSSGSALLPEGWVDDGRLTADRLAALETIVRPPAADTYALTVLTTTVCNLGCSYCFQNTAPAAPGRSDSARITAVRMDAATVDATARFAAEQLRRTGRSALYVLLFGGEPLANPAACRNLLERLGAVAGMRAGIVTNGTLMRPRVLQDLEQLGLRDFQITVDGPRPLHDAVRVTRRGGATFDRVLRNTASVIEKTDLRCVIRVQVSGRAAEDLDSLVGELADRLPAARCEVRFVPIVGAGAPAICSPADLVRGYGAALAAGFRLPRPTFTACAFCSCPTGHGGAVVSADGNLYSCWESVGRPGYEVGTVHTGFAADRGSAWVRCAAVPADHADAVDAALLDLLWSVRASRQPSVGDGACTGLEAAARPQP